MKPTRLSLFLLCASFLVMTRSELFAAPGQYSNPVLPGDFPDPSVIRVGDEYWATATTSEWGPLFPLLRSRDLVHWERVGNVFARRPDWAVANFWAPEISAYRGRYYIYFVGRKKDGPLSIAVATSEHPRGPWTDHGPLIGQPAGSIDADTAVDENGVRFLIWKEDGNSRNLPTPIWAQPLSDDGLRLVGEMKELLRNTDPWEKNLVEGPFVQRRGDYFYLFYSGNGCCGAGCNYALGVARARKLLGPWEKNPANPILAANDSWRCPGHGSIVSTPDGRDFFLYHAYSAQTFIYVGRQGLLDEVQWGADGWPTLNRGHGPSRSAAAPLPLQIAPDPRRFEDEFTSESLGPIWQWPVNNEPVVRLERNGGGKLRLSPAPGHADEWAGAVIAVPTTAGDYEATTQIDQAQLGPGAQAGLSALGDQANALGLSVVDHQLKLWRRQKGKQEVTATVPAPAGATVQFRLRASGGHKFRFSASADGRDWKTVGSDIDLEGNYLPPWDRGVRVALVTGGPAGTVATFDWLRVQPGPDRR
jgi:beta-xylosidase